MYLDDIITKSNYTIGYTYKTERNKENILTNIPHIRILNIKDDFVSLSSFIKGKIRNIALDTILDIKTLDSDIIINRVGDKNIETIVVDVNDIYLSERYKSMPRMHIMNSFLNDIEVIKNYKIIITSPINRNSIINNTTSNNVSFQGGNKLLNNVELAIIVNENDVNVIKSRFSQTETISLNNYDSK